MFTFPQTEQYISQPLIYQSWGTDWDGGKVIELTEMSIFGKHSSHKLDVLCGSYRILNDLPFCIIFMF